MNPALVTCAIGGWYPRGAARLIESLERQGCTIPLYSWINVYPPESPTDLPYRSKPHAMRHAQSLGHDIVIWIDAAFYAIRPINPLIEHIARIGYYLVDNGAIVGEWCRDAALAPLGIDRETSMRITEASSYCVGLNFHDARCRELLNRWTETAHHPDIFPGPHTNTAHPDFKPPARNAGWCSDDPRVKGHRHDQTALSVIAWQLGMFQLTPRPVFCDYAHDDVVADERTLMLNSGGVR